MHLGKRLCYRNGMCDVGLAGLAGLPLVRLGAELVGMGNRLYLLGRQIGLYRFEQATQTVVAF